MNTDKVVQRYEIPESVIEPGRGIISLNVDVNMESCDNAYAYISDFLTQSLLVYRLERCDSSICSVDRIIFVFNFPKFERKSHVEVQS